MVLGAMALATAVFFWEALLMRGTFFVQDVMVQNYPFRDFFASALKEFEFPLWHPGINCGFPLFAEGQAGALYPFNLLLGLLLPTYVGLNLSVIVHTWLAAAGTYGFTRLLGCRRSAALTAAITYAFSGFLIVRAMSQNYQAVAAWFPMLFLLSELVLQRRRPWTWLGLMAAVVGLQFLAGHPQATLYGLVAAGLYGFVRGMSAGAGRSRVIALVVAVPALGAALAAVQLLPTWELVQLSGRGDGLPWETFVSMSMPPERLITLLLPNFYGNSSMGTYWAGEHGFFIQLCPYIGILPLLLCFSATRNRADVPTAFFVGLGVLALLLSLGKYTTLYSLIYQLPGLSFFRIPTRFLLWWALGAAVLAGLGLDRMLAGGRPSSSSIAVPPPSRGWPFAWTVAAAACLGSLLWVNRQVLSTGISQWLTQSSPAGDMLSLYCGDLAWDGMRLLAMSAAAWILFARFWRGVSSSWGWGVAALVFIDLYSFGASFNPLIPAETYTHIPASAQAIRERTQQRDDDGSVLEASTGKPSTVSPFRVVSTISERSSPYDWHSAWALDRTSYIRYPETLRMYSATLYGLDNTLPGWSPLHLRSHWQFIRGYPALLKVANARFQIAHNTLRNSKLDLVHDGIVKVYEDPDFLPRAYVVDADTVISQASSRLRFMRGDEFEPARRVVLSRRPWKEAENASGNASASSTASGRAFESRITHYEPEEVRIVLGPHDGGLLVLSDTYYPGWRAWVDDLEVPIAEANHVFRAVPLKSDAREVVFRFMPISFRVGVWISMASALLVLVAVWKRRKSEVVVKDLGDDKAAAIGSHIRHWVIQVGLIIVLHGVCRLWPLWRDAAERASIPMGWGW